MGIGRSTFYDTPDARASDAIIVAEMKTICDQFEAYGYRRVDAELRHRGIVVNAKKIRRLMREHALNPKQRRRFIATTDSDHNYPIFPDLAKNMMPDSHKQLWVADITYVAIATGFVYLAAILDAWSRRVVGYASSRMPAHQMDNHGEGRLPGHRQGHHPHTQGPIHWSECAIVQPTWPPKMECFNEVRSDVTNDVRFPPHSDRTADAALCRLCANKRR